MLNTLTIKDCIEDPEKIGSIKDYMATGKDRYGMQTFDRHLMDLNTEGVIDTRWRSQQPQAPQTSNAM